MTLDEIRASDKTMLTPCDIATVLCCDPQLIRLQAREQPERLGFPVIVMGSRVKIPRKPFLAFVGEEA